MNEAEGEIQLTEPNNGRLYQYSEGVTVQEITTPEIQGIIQRMKQFANINRLDPNKPIARGLADVQLKEKRKPKNIILFDASTDTNNPGFRVVLNIKIVEASREHTSLPEGCFSYPGYAVLASRPNWLVYTGNDEFGNRIPPTRVEGPIAQRVSHEYDHTIGRPNFSRTRSDQDLLIVETGEVASFRQDAKNWPKKAEPEDINRMTGRKIIKDRK